MSTSSESGLLHTFFIYSQAFNNLISNGKSYCCNDTFLLTSGYIAASIEYLRIQIIHAVRISMSLAILSEIFIQIGYFC